jgi:hypothetical protein
MLSEKTKNEESVLVYRAEIYIRMLVGLLLASLSAVTSTPYTQQVYNSSSYLLFSQSELFFRRWWPLVLRRTPIRINNVSIYVFIHVEVNTHVSSYHTWILWILFRFSRRHHANLPHTHSTFTVINGKGVNVPYDTRRYRYDVIYSTRRTLSLVSAVFNSSTIIVSCPALI